MKWFVRNDEINLWIKSLLTLTVSLLWARSARSASYVCRWWDTTVGTDPGLSTLLYRGVVPKAVHMRIWASSVKQSGLKCFSHTSLSLPNLKVLTLCPVPQKCSHRCAISLFSGFLPSGIWKNDSPFPFPGFPLSLRQSWTWHSGMTALVPLCHTSEPQYSHELFTVIQRNPIPFRLLHSPSLLASGLSVGHEKWPAVGWYHPIVIGWSILTRVAMYCGPNLHV